MAYNRKNHLIDKASEEFLESRGFVLVKTCTNYSAWYFPGYSNYLILNTNTVITSDIVLYEHIFGNGYDEGKDRTEKLLKNQILNKIELLLFPLPEENIEKKVIDYC